VITETKEKLKHAKQLLMIYSDVNKDQTAVAGAMILIHENGERKLKTTFVNDNIMPVSQKTRRVRDHNRCL
jgi:hypothetical protein